MLMKTCLPRTQWSLQPQDQGPGDESEVTQEVADREHWYPGPCPVSPLGARRSPQWC